MTTADLRITGQRFLMLKEAAPVRASKPDPAWASVPCVSEQPEIAVTNEDPAAAAGFVSFPSEHNSPFDFASGRPGGQTRRFDLWRYSRISRRLMGRTTSAIRRRPLGWRQHNAWPRFTIGASRQLRSNGPREGTMR